MLDKPGAGDARMLGMLVKLARMCGMQVGVLSVGSRCLRWPVTGC